MKNYRKYGAAPFKVAVVHGGPGAPGSIASVARELASVAGILEPLQTKSSIDAQVEELCEVLENHAGLPAVLIGHSWGAWLVFITAARYPALVKKLVLVASGPFEQHYASAISGERLTRLSEDERIEVFELIEIFNNNAPGDRDKSLGRLGELFAKADTFSALPQEKESEPLPASEEINRLVWKEAEKLRVSGELLELGKKIACPVVAIHGAYDPHPVDGVRVPLERVLPDFRFFLLEKCGHEPWLEKYARDRFFKILVNEIK